MKLLVPYSVYYLIGLSYYYKQDYFKALNYLWIAKKLNPTEEIENICNQVFEIYHKTIGKE